MDFEDILQAYFASRLYNDFRQKPTGKSMRGAMKKEIRTIVYDEELHIEAYQFDGILQPFPNHFHEYYVIGLIESGNRLMTCKNKEYLLPKGSIVLFNPGDNHGCAPVNEEPFTYRAINISKETMAVLAKEITGQNTLPGFSKNVIFNKEVVCCLQPLHELIMNNSHEFEKEEYLLLLLSLLIQHYGQPFESCVPPCQKEIEKACAFMEQHYPERICLEQICRHAGLSKSTLLRAFTRSKGVTPYCYLENIRIGAAKKLLEAGYSPAEAALQTGFFDQSHFTNYFSRYIGLAPGLYREIFFNKTASEDKDYEA